MHSLSRVSRIVMTASNTRQPAGILSSSCSSSSRIESSITSRVAQIVTTDISNTGMLVLVGMKSVPPDNRQRTTNEISN